MVGGDPQANLIRVSVSNVHFINPVFYCSTYTLILNQVWVYIFRNAAKI